MLEKDKSVKYFQVTTYTVLVILPMLPLVAYAASAPTDFRSFVGILLNIIEILVVFVFALTFLVLVWGIMKAWIINGGDQAEVDKGKKVALVGVIALVIMSGIWGIVELLRSSLFGL